MRKLFTLLLLCCVTSIATAQSIVVVSGGIDFLKTERKLQFEFTYNGMLVGKMSETDYLEKKTTEFNKKEEGRGDKWRKSWIEDRENRFKPKFLELFTKYMDENGTPFEVGDAKYLVKINTNFTEPGFNVGVVRQNAAIDLVCEFIEVSTGKQVALINIRDASANSFSGFDFDTGFRIQECYAKAGRELAKFIIKKAGIKSEK